MDFPFFEEFKSACEQICFDLGIDFDDIKLSHNATAKIGLDYVGHGGLDNNYFNFHVRTVTKEDDVQSGQMTASLEITYSESASTFYFHENIDYMRGHPGFLGRWTAWAVSKFNSEHNPVNLDSLFHEMDIKTYGVPRYSHPTQTEFRIFLNGVSKLNMQKLLIYKFRHAEDNYHYRAYSYAFFPISEHLGSLWVFFPQLRGLDSGGASGDLRDLEEEIINLGIPIERNFFDIPYEKLAKFLDENALNTFGNKTIDDETLKFLGLDKHSSPFGTSFDESYEKILEYLDEKEIPEALRNLRILIQESLETLCTQSSISLGDDKDRTIAKLAEKLIKNNVMDEELRIWFMAFSSIANKSAHRAYPGKTEEQDLDLMRRINLTLAVGMNLVSELEKYVQHS